MSKGVESNLGSLLTSPNAGVAAAHAQLDVNLFNVALEVGEGFGQLFLHVRSDSWSDLQLAALNDDLDRCGAS
eukprot:scaffold490875_cov47-Prasinocladus_malaysianus.AAC.1